MLKMFRSFACPALLTSLVACSGGPATPDPEAYQDEMRIWQDQYLQSLTQPEGWLSLVGLLWLNEGDNDFGSGDHADLRLVHADLPEQAGVFTLNDGTVRFRADDGAAITANGQPVSEIEIDVDVAGDPATVLRSGNLHIIVIERGGRYGLRIRDLESAARLEFPGLDFYPVDIEWRIVARFIAYDRPQTLTVTDVTGAVRDLESPGRAVFELRGREFSLIAVDQSSTNELFFLFLDRTSGSSTYGAGRYLDVDYEAGDDWIILDFNKAYNPPCAYTQYTLCPLTPAANRLSIRVTAGERDFVSGYH
jgi:uncharacterized protein